jgi:hypothetical protein
MTTPNKEAAAPKTVEDLKATWNAQADAMNQWDELGLDEIVHFAQEQMLAGIGNTIAALRWTAAALQAIAPDTGLVTVSGESRTVGRILDDANNALTASEAAAQDHIEQPLGMVAQEAQAPGELSDTIARGEALLQAGAMLANVAFNWAQMCGHTLTSEDCSMLDKLRKEWDEARRAAPAQAGMTDKGAK